MSTISEPAAGQPAAESNAKAVDSPTDIIYFEKWLEMMGERKATDLHLNVGNVPALRIDGAIVPLNEEDVLTAERLQKIMEHVLDENEQKILAQEKSVIASRTLKKIMRCRIHVFYSRGFLAASLRHLTGEEVGWRELGLPEVVGEMAKESSGLLIITGPFDSGKTASLRGLLSEINHTQARYIVTLEQPIEYLLPSDKSVVAQRQVGRDAPSFADGLASLQNDDVNVAAVSALPDAAAAEEALKLAGTGRLVLAVLGSRTVVDSLEEVRDLFAEQDRARAMNLLADCLLGAVAQILLPKVGGGRVLVTEVLRATAPVKTLIREGKLAQVQQIMQTSREQGMVTMDRALVDAVQAGKAALAVAREHAVDPNQFNLLASH